MITITLTTLFLLYWAYKLYRFLSYDPFAKKAEKEVLKYNHDVKYDNKNELIPVREKV